AADDAQKSRRSVTFAADAVQAEADRQSLAAFHTPQSSLSSLSGASVLTDLFEDAREEEGGGAPPERRPVVVFSQQRSGAGEVAEAAAPAKARLPVMLFRGQDGVPQYAHLARDRDAQQQQQQQQQQRSASADTRGIVVRAGVRGLLVYTTTPAEPRKFGNSSDEQQREREAEGRWRARRTRKAAEPLPDDSLEDSEARGYGVDRTQASRLALMGLLRGLDVDAPLHVLGRDQRVELNISAG
ncbi:MAG: hypothetical protein ACK4ZJ_17780, partial [Allorhizobium sp.]